MRGHAAQSEFVRDYLASGLTQEQFCELHRPSGGPSARSLRAYLAALTKPAGFTAEARAIIERAMADLQGLLQALDAVEHAQGQEVDGGAERDHQEAAAGHCRQAVGRALTPAAPKPAAAERRAAVAAGPPRTHATLLDDIAAAVQEAVKDAENVGDVVNAEYAPTPPTRKSYFGDL